MKMKMGVQVLLLAAALNQSSLLLAGDGISKVMPSITAIATSGRCPVQVWNAGALLLIENHMSEAPIIHAYDQDGQEIQRVVFRIPGAKMINIYSQRFARDADGALVLSGCAYTNDGRASNFLAFLTPQGSVRKLIRTDPFVPRAVAIASDGTIWTAGLEKAGHSEAKDDYAVIRRFDKDGNMIGSALGRRKFSAARVEHPAAYSFFVVSRDRVGWYSDSHQLYIEFALDGSELGRYSAAFEVKSAEGGALCKDNTVWFVSGTKEDKRKGTAQSYKLLSLDREHRTWVTRSERPTPLHLFGCEDTTLVMSPGSPDTLELLPIR